MSTTMIDQKGRVLLPARVRRVLDLKTGSSLVVEVLADGVKLRKDVSMGRDDAMFKDFKNPAHIAPKMSRRGLLERLEQELWVGYS